MVRVVSFIIDYGFCLVWVPGPRDGPCPDSAGCLRNRRGVQVFFKKIPAGVFWAGMRVSRGVGFWGGYREEILCKKELLGRRRLGRRGARAAHDLCGVLLRNDSMAEAV